MSIFQKISNYKSMFFLILLWFLPFLVRFLVYISTYPQFAVLNKQSGLAVLTGENKFFLLCFAISILLTQIFIYSQSLNRHKKFISNLYLVGLTGVFWNVFELLTLGSVLDYLPIYRLAIINLSDIYIYIGVITCLYNIFQTFFKVNLNVKNS